MRQKAFSAIFGTSLVLNAILWALVLNFFPRNNPATVLHYSIDVGIDLIGEGKQIIVLPAIGLIALIGNSLLGATLRRRSPVTAWIVWSVIPILQIILLGSFLLIWQANIYRLCYVIIFLTYP